MADDVCSDLRLEDILHVALETEARPFFVDLAQAAITNGIGDQDCGGFTFTAGLTPTPLRLFAGDPMEHSMFHRAGDSPIPIAPAYGGRHRLGGPGPLKTKTQPAEASGWV